MLRLITTATTATTHELITPVALACLETVDITTEPLTAMEIAGTQLASLLDSLVTAIWFAVNQINPLSGSLKSSG